jgi:hypothetical protein
MLKNRQTNKYMSSFILIKLNICKNIQIIRILIQLVCLRLKMKVKSYHNVHIKLNDTLYIIHINCVIKSHLMFEYFKWKCYHMFFIQSDSHFDSCATKLRHTNQFYTASQQQCTETLPKYEST